MNLGAGSIVQYFYMKITNKLSYYAVKMNTKNCRIIKELWIVAQNIIITVRYMWRC